MSSVSAGPKPDMQTGIPTGFQTGIPSGFQKSIRKTERKDPAAAVLARRNAELRGRVAEWLAAALLMLKGYRIVARRHRSRFGEIDLIATRGRRLAFVEVKQRRSAEEAAAAVSHRQASRIADAAEHWLWRNPRYRECDVGLDAVLFGSRFWPRHVPNALNGW